MELNSILRLLCSIAWAS